MEQPPKGMLFFVHLHPLGPISMIALNRGIAISVEAYRLRKAIIALIVVKNSFSK
jgi:hypothetical protein